MSEQKAFLSKREAAAFLHITTCSVNNWIKQGLLKWTEKGLSFHEVDNLKRKIASGDVARLHIRANKSRSRRSFIPDELIAHPGDKEELTALFSRIKQIQNGEAPPGEGLYYIISLNLLIKEKIVPLPQSPSHTAIVKSIAERRPNLFRELQSWQEELDPKELNLYAPLMETPLPDVPDILGILYQGFLPEGKKSRGGSYYTPTGLIREAIKEMLPDTSTALDPCCGTGQFLSVFAEHLSNPENIYGADIDPLAVRIARINLFIRFKEEDFSPRIFCTNTLITPPVPGSFDLIATNPPWGYHYSPGEREELNTLHPEITSGESFSYFLKQSIHSLKEGGRLVFFLPEAVLNVKNHRDIRDYILKHCRINSITLLKKVFKNVFSPLVILSLEKTSNPGENRLKVSLEKKSYEVDSRSFSENPDKIFNIHITGEDYSIIRKIYETPHITLKGRARWGLGIVTGNNKLHVTDSPADPSMEPVFRGADIEPFRLKKPRFYISFTPEKYQQVAREEIYRTGEKLIYKFISSSLCFARDTGSHLTLNSANILIPQVENIPAKAIMALFNSQLFQYLYNKQFASLKILKNHLETLPLPLMKEETLARLLFLTDRITDGESAYREELDKLVFSLFSLSPEEIEAIRQSL